MTASDEIYWVAVCLDPRESCLAISAHHSKEGRELTVSVSCAGGREFESHRPTKSYGSPRLNIYTGSCVALTLWRVYCHKCIHYSRQTVI